MGASWEGLGTMTAELNEHRRRKRDLEDNLIINNINQLHTGMMEGFRQVNERMDTGFLNVHRRIDDMVAAHNDLREQVVKIEADKLPERVETLEGKESIRNKVLGITIAISGIVGSVIGAVLAYFAFIKGAIKSFIAGS